MILFLTILSDPTSIIQVSGRTDEVLKLWKISVHADPSTGSGLKAVEGACPEAPRRVEAFFAVFQQSASFVRSVTLCLGPP